MDFRMVCTNEGAHHQDVYLSHLVAADPTLADSDGPPWSIVVVPQGSRSRRTTATQSSNAGGWLTEWTCGSCGRRYRMAESTMRQILTASEPLGMSRLDLSRLHVG